MTESTAVDRSPLVYASALAIDVPTMKLVPEADTIAHEIDVVLSRIGTRLAGSGLDLGDVVKTTCYLSDEAHLVEFEEAFAAAFPADRRPVNCTVILGLAGNCRVQIDTIAVRRAAAA